MSADVDIEAWLTELGYGLPAAKLRARAALEAEGLTRAGKQRLSVEKKGRAAAFLGGRFFRHCSKAECLAAGKTTGRELALCDPRSTCERCGGSDNQRTVTELLEACRAAQATKLVVVGGSPATREELERLLGDRLELRLIDGTIHRAVERAQADLEWADVCLMWGATELHHKVSMQYTNATGALKRKVVLVQKRGIAQLLTAAVEFLRGRS